MLIPSSFFTVFGESPDAVIAMLIAMADEEGIELEYGKHPALLDAGEIRRFFGIVVH